MRLPSLQALRAAHLARGAVHVEQRAVGHRHLLELLDHRATKRAAGSKSSGSQRRPARKSTRPVSACWETAIAGMPSTIPSSAAATVPE